MNEGHEINNASKEQIVEKIMLIRQQIAIMGGNDYEIPTLDNLILRLQKGECSPADALKEAQSMLNKKQDYH